MEALMFLTRLLQILLGYVIFKVEGGNKEKFLNLSARAGVRLWNLHHDGLAFCASTLASNYKKLLPEAKKAGVCLSIISKKGVPVAFERHHKRLGFLAGFAVFIALIIYFSGYVWTVEISGNKAVSSREIQYALSDLGFSAGVRRDTFNLKNLEQQALMKLPGLSYMHINLDGSVAKVIVGERSQRPEIVPDDRPCNIKASQTGQIINMKVYQGVTTLKKNDVVQKDELLVSGVVEEPKSGITRYLHARAEIIALTKHQLVVKVPYKTTEMQDTGKVVKNYALNILNLQIPFYRSEPQGDYRRMVYKNPLIIGGVELPVSTSVTVFYEYHETPVVLSKQQAAQKAKALMTQKENTELSSVTVKRKTYTQKADSSSFTLTGNYECEEDIALTQEVRFGQK
jgi:similar to stage IV sporulation protein